MPRSCWASARAGGFEITADADEADVLVVNTCGFIESAKQESIDAILEARRRPEQKLIVSGCLAQRYRERTCARTCPRWTLSSGWTRWRLPAKFFAEFWMR